MVRNIFAKKTMPSKINIPKHLNGSIIQVDGEKNIQIQIEEYILTSKVSSINENLIHFILEGYISDNSEVSSKVDLEFRLDSQVQDNTSYDNENQNNDDEDNNLQNDLLPFDKQTVLLSFISARSV